MTHYSGTQKPLIENEVVRLLHNISIFAAISSDIVIVFAMSSSNRFFNLVAAVELIILCIGYDSAKKKYYSGMTTKYILFSFQIVCFLFSLEYIFAKALTATEFRRGFSEKVYPMATDKYVYDFVTDKNAAIYLTIFVFGWFIRMLLTLVMIRLEKTLIKISAFRNANNVLARI